MRVAKPEERPSLSLISPYRFKDDCIMADASSSALAWYTHELAQAMTASRTVSVISPRRPGDSPWRDGEVYIAPSYDRGHIDVALQIAMAAARETNMLHIQHELFAYGGILSAFTLPLVMKYLKHSRCPVVTTLHGVMSLSSIDYTFVASNNIKAPVAVVKSAWRRLVRDVCSSCNIVHVHEPHHRNILRDEYGITTRIEQHPHGASLRNRMVKSEARSSLGISSEANVVLFFGFLLERKGIIPFLEAVETMLSDDHRLVILLGGSIPQRISTTNGIESRIAELRKRDRVRYLGFVSDSQIHRLFSATDVLILPYTVSIAASGPMAHAIGFDVPVLLSAVFRQNYPGAPAIFDPTPSGIASAIRAFFAIESIRNECATFVSALRQERSWPALAQWLNGIYLEATHLRRSRR